MKWIIKVIAYGAALWVAVWWIDGLTFDGDFWNFLLLSLLVVAANVFIKPIVNFFSLPFILVTLGLFLLVTNALVLQFVVWLSGVWELGLASTGFFWATFLSALVVTVVAWIIEKVLD